MGALLKLSNLIDYVNEQLGRFFAWGVLVTVLVSAANAFIRYTFSVSSNFWLELQWLIFGAVFMVCASWTLKVNEHIRIDIVSNLLPRRIRSLIDLIGHTFFLMPFCILMVYETAPYFWKSLQSGEVSSNAGGIIVWPTKFFIFFGFLLLLCQAISELIKRIAVMRGMIPDPIFMKRGHHHDPTIDATLEGIEK